jgi:hypothetical protein
VWIGKVLKDRQFDIYKQMEVATYGNLHRKERAGKVEGNEDEGKLGYEPTELSLCFQRILLVNEN